VQWHYAQVTWYLYRAVDLHKAAGTKSKDTTFESTKKSGIGMTDRNWPIGTTGWGNGTNDTRNPASQVITVSLNTSPGSMVGPGILDMPITN
jgi:hypothetical protein